MKKIFNIAAAAAMVFGLAACQIESEDAFSTDPVAPEMEAHSNILMTANTMSEDVIFSWAKARFMGDNVTYTVSLSYEDSSAELGSTQDLVFVTSKANFKSFIDSKFPSIPENSTFSLTAKVSTT